MIKAIQHAAFVYKKKSYRGFRLYEWIDRKTGLAKTVYILTFTEKSAWPERIEKMIMINGDNANFYCWSISSFFFCFQTNAITCFTQIYDLLSTSSTYLISQTIFTCIFRKSKCNLNINFLSSCCRQHENAFTSKCPYGKVIGLSLFVITCINKSCLPEMICTKFKDIYNNKHNYFCIVYLCFSVSSERSLLFLCIIAQKQDTKCTKITSKRQKPLRF